MNKTQIVAAFAEKAGITKTDASKFFNALMGVMADANSTSKCKITKCFCKSTPLVLRNSIFFLVSH